MTNQQDDGTSLPADVVAEIFAYLPAKSVGRLRCLSRPWHATLSSAPFVKLHLKRANDDKPKIFFSPTECDSDDDYQFYAWQPGVNAAVAKLMRNDFWRPALLTRPLHGLVLIHCVVEGGYCVCNPSTGEVRPLPDSRAPLKMTFRSYSLPYYFHAVYGFGYCSVSHEYKAVRVFSKNSDEAPPSCEVFVLGGDTPPYWRPTASQPPMCVVEEVNPAVFLHGHLHFLCRDDGRILTFNVGDETFGTLPGPPCPPGKDPLRTTELDGCLCVFRGGGDGPCHVWLLENYGARRWEELCCFYPTGWPEPEKTLLQSGWIAPLQISSGDNGSQKNIMFGTGKRVVFTVPVDLCRGGIPEILLKPDDVIAGDFDDAYNHPAMGLFEESLVTLGSSTEDMVFSSPVTKAWSEVLKWLPAMSVQQLSLVCKEWRAMVTTDRFIRSHAAVHATSPRIMFVSDPTIGSFTHIDRRPQVFNVGLFRCSQPCHGLNLGTWNLWDYLCNPTTGYRERVYVEDRDRDDFSFAGRVALGYDQDIDDHVIVSLVYEKKNMETRYYELECHVRSLRGTWDLVDPPPRPVAIDVQPAYSNGKIYWVVEPKLGPCSPVCELVAFDTWDREFKIMEGPPCSDLGTRGRVSILELYGTICMACCDEDRNAIDVWMMKDDDGSWCVECHIELQKFSPEYSSQNTTLLCADPSDGQILLNTGRSFGYYDPRTAALETIYTIGEQDGDSGFCPVIVQDSLVQPFMKQT